MNEEYLIDMGNILEEMGINPIYINEITDFLCMFECITKKDIKYLKILDKQLNINRIPRWSQGKKLSLYDIYGESVKKMKYIKGGKIVFRMREKKYYINIFLHSYVNTEHCIDPQFIYNFCRQAKLNIVNLLKNFRNNEIHKGFLLAESQGSLYIPKDLINLIIEFIY